ncbi:TetR/AcrR family transcriptional regulator [Quadrisphaera oryzae]|uniref:TetR/AcrR family transcriptional regulator n=1 Tax=Quadrisphaera TaxID=317661 RepID=UPI001C969CEA
MAPPADPATLTAKGRTTRARIIDAAAGLVFVHGVERTALEAVRNEAGVSASQLYHYFADKQDLVRAVVARQSEAVLAAQQPWLAQLDSLAAFRAWADALVELQRQRHCVGGCPIGSIGIEVGEDDPLVRADVAVGLQRWQDALTEGLRRVRTSGELPADFDVEVAGLALLAAVQGGLVLTQARRDPEPLRVALATVLDSFEQQR